MPILINQAMVQIGLGTAGLVALLGYTVVFLGLILLMLAVLALGKIMTGKMKKNAESQKTNIAPVESAPEPDQMEALVAAMVVPLLVMQQLEQKDDSMSQGTLHTQDVSELDTAIILAAIARDSGVPLHDLHVKSIRRIS